MTERKSEIPDMWKVIKSDPLECEHSIESIEVRVQRAPSGAGKVKEGKEFKRGNETKWEAILDKRNAIRIREKKSSIDQAETEAIDFMCDFSEAYNGDCDKAISEAI